MAPKPRNRASLDAEAVARLMNAQDAEADMPNVELPSQPGHTPQETQGREQARPLPDGRSLRATGRVHQFSTRVKLETHDEMKWLALNERITLGELLEKMVAAYKREKADR